jgi:hypothetical protein
MRAASVNDPDVQEVLDELHTYLPIPRFERDDDVNRQVATLLGDDGEARSQTLKELDQHATNERVGEGIFEFDLRAVPKWIPKKRRKLYAKVIVELDAALTNNLATGADEIVHFFAGAFIKYGSKSALANSTSDIAAALAIQFVGMLTGIEPDRDKRMVALGHGNLLEIIRSADAALKLAVANDPLPEALRHHRKS